VNVLVTGGSGFIGNRIVARVKRGHTVSDPSHDELALTNTAAVKRYLCRRSFDAVVHTATVRSNRLTGTPPDLLGRNLLMFLNVGIFGRMFFMGSGKALGTLTSNAMEEDLGAQIPADDYGLSKYLCAKLADMMEHVCELRLFGVFGPGEDHRVRFISNACCRALYDMPITINQNRRFSYLDAEDLARLVEDALVSGLTRKHYNVCPPQVFELRDLAERVIRISGKNLPITIKTSGMGPDYSGSNARLTAEMPGFKFTGIDESIERLYLWYEALKDQINPNDLGFDGVKA